MLSASTMQYLNQLGGLVTFVDIEDTGRAVAYKLVPCTHYHDHKKFPHEVERELRAESFRTTVIEGLEYYLVPETTTNAVGTVAQYVQPDRPTQEVSMKPPPAQVKYIKRDSKAKTGDNKSS